MFSPGGGVIVLKASFMELNYQQMFYKMQQEAFVFPLCFSEGWFRKLAAPFPLLQLWLVLKVPSLSFIAEALCFCSRRKWWASFLPNFCLFLLQAFQKLKSLLSISPSDFSSDDDVVTQYRNKLWPHTEFQHRCVWVSINKQIPDIA